MSREHANVKIWIVESDQLADAKLFDDVDQGNVTDHQQRWIPQLEKANAEAKDASTPQRAEDAHWNWGHKVQSTKGQIAFRHFALEYNDYTVGLLMLKLVGAQSRIVQGSDIVYIDYLAACPEARTEIHNPRIYSGIGKVLFMAAVLVSQEEGMKGRVGLHSLPKAKQWYSQKLGLQSFGPDPSYQNLEYFELSETQATKLVAEMEGRRND